MIRPYLKLVKVTCSLCLIFLALFYALNPNTGNRSDTVTVGFAFFLILLSACAVYVLFHLFIKHKASQIEQLSFDQAEFLDHLPARYVGPAIIGSASASLFLELALIRWQGELFPIFSFYKNYSLLACFAGLGIGYSLARSKAIPLFCYLPILVIQFMLILFLRHKVPGSALWTTPFAEQLNMGIVTSARFSSNLITIYFFLALIFLQTELCFIPIGQLCGRLMGRMNNLPAYGYNLIGSILGIVLVTSISYFWTPSVIWFCICFTILLFFQAFTPRIMLINALGIAASVIILSWPASPGHELIHSPYQLIERGTGDNGLTVLKAAGHYYQRIVDLGFSNANRYAKQWLQACAAYYELPYKVYGKPPDRVAIVGSGTGNDVAAALRFNTAQVDAVEIDPAILKLGQIFHPEKPYSDARVKPILNDARTFLRLTPRKYDMIIYGLLDSHTLLSHSSSIRLDSFVYTVEALKEAKKRLKPDGLLSLSFCVLSKEIGRKIYLMLEEAFDGKPPVCIRANYDGSVIFFQSNDDRLKIDRAFLKSTGFEDWSEYFANASIQADIPTDDWPFFYMPQRVYPFSYMGMFGLILLLSSVTTFSFKKQQPVFGGAAFFFLGAGFMLIETKAITELGLVFGNTWQVIGIAISGILLMAFLANCVVQWFRIRSPMLTVLLLITSLIAGYLISNQGGLGSSVGGKIGTVLLLTLPMFFSGILFSTLLADTKPISGIMAINIMGAMAGGLLEYNSMYFGFRFLYLLAVIMYGLAFLSYTSSKTNSRFLRFPWVR